MKKLVATFGVVTLALSLTGCAGGFSTFQDAQTACGSPSGVSVQDNGKTLAVDMMGDEDYTGASYDDVLCIVTQVGTPSYIKEAMWATRALDGRQSDEFDGISVSWSYHPDTGIDILYHKK